MRARKEIRSMNLRTWTTRRRVGGVAAAVVLVGALVTAAPAAASAPSATSASVTPTAASATNATYMVNFTTSSSGALTTGSDTITLVFPTGTVLSTSAADYNVKDNTAVVGMSANASSVNVSGSTVTITLPITTQGGAALTVTANKATNAPTAGSQSLQIKTSKDTDFATATFTLTAAGPNVSQVNPAIGPSGTATPITITGSGFTGATSVTIGGTAATGVVVDSPTQIRALTPSNGTAANQPVVVTTPSGSSSGTANNGVNTFTYKTGLQFVPESPVRILDSRTAAGGPQGPYAPGTAQVIQVSGLANVPGNAAAVVLNVTAVGARGPGNLRVYPDGVQVPNASTINYQSGADTANGDIVSLPSNGKIDVLTFGSNIDVVFDVVGYYVNGATSYTPQTPVRLLDTRPGNNPNQGITGPIGAGRSVTVQVSGNAGVPQNASAVALNVTAIGPTGVGNLRIAPQSGSSPGPAPDTSTVNYVPGTDVANFAVVTLPQPVTSGGAGGQIALYSFGSDVNVALDVVGYYTGPTNNSYTALGTPARVFDTRNGNNTQVARIVPDNPRSAPIAGKGGVPSDGSVTAVVVNVTGIQPNPGFGNLRAYPEIGTAGTASTPPGTSTLNYVRFEDTANFAILAVRNGNVDLATFGSSADATIDVVGYYTN